MVGSLAVDQATASLRCRNTKLKRQLGWNPRLPTYREGFADMLRAASAASQG
jgi:hypothetical protein